MNAQTTTTTNGRPGNNTNTTNNHAPNTTPKPSRMTLASVTRGPVAQPLRVVIYGPGGVGKSTFGAQAPDAVFLGPEDGSSVLDVSRFPSPESWTDVLDAIRVLTTEEHGYRSLVIDSADWLEPLCWAHTCAAARKPDIESFGYGKGYVAALEEWRKLLAAIELLRRTKQMHVIVIAHSVVGPYKNPEGEDYDRFGLKLHKGAAGLLTEWCDELCYAGFRTHASKVDPKLGNRGRGYGSERVLYTERRAAFDAKSRHGLPPEMPLSFEEFFAATQRGTVEMLASLRAEVTTALAQLEAFAPDIATKARAACEGVVDVSKLGTYLNTIRARVAEHAPDTANTSNNTNTAD